MLSTSSGPPQNPLKSRHKRQKLLAPVHDVVFQKVGYPIEINGKKSTLEDILKFENGWM
jgi:hypothetical protein